MNQNKAVIIFLCVAVGIIALYALLQLPEQFGRIQTQLQQQAASEQFQRDLQARQQAQAQAEANAAATRKRNCTELNPDSVVDNPRQFKAYTPNVCIEGKITNIDMWADTCIESSDLIVTSSKGGEIRIGVIDRSDGCYPTSIRNGDKVRVYGEITFVRPLDEPGHPYPLVIGYTDLDVQR